MDLDIHEIRDDYEVYSLINEIETSANEERLKYFNYELKKLLKNFNLDKVIKPKVKYSLFLIIFVICKEYCNLFCRKLESPNYNLLADLIIAAEEAIESNIKKISDSSDSRSTNKTLKNLENLKYRLEAFQEGLRLGHSVYPFPVRSFCEDLLCFIKLYTKSEDEELLVSHLEKLLGQMNEFEL